MDENTATAEDNSKSETSAPEGTPQEEAPREDPLVPFVHDLSSSSSEEDRYTKLRATPTGLFISQDRLEHILQCYSEWLKKSSSNVPVGEKLVRKLLGEESPALYYLLDGKTTLVGYIAKGILKPTKQIHIPFFQGSLINAQDYLHMRDPIFQEHDSVNAIVGSGGFQIEFESKNGKLLTTQDSLKNFSQLIEHSPYLLKKHPSVTQALRNVIPALAKIWKEAKPITTEYKNLVPPAFRKEKDSDIFHWSELILLRQKDNQLGFSYGKKGRNFRSFLTLEVRKLHRKKLNVQDFHFLNQRGLFGSLRVGNDTLRIQERTVREFTEHIHQLQQLRELLPNRYTAKDALDQLLTLLKASRWVEPHALPKHVTEGSGSQKTFRKKDDWIFIFGKNFTLETISHRDLDKHSFHKRDQSHKRDQRKPPRTKVAKGAPGKS